MISPLNTKLDRKWIEASQRIATLEQQVAALRIDAALGKAIRPNYEEAKTRGVEYIRWTVSDIDAAMGEK